MLLQPYAHFVIIAVAVLTAIGGIIGFVKARSMISMIMGVVSGVFLGVTAYLAANPDTSKMGCSAALVLMFLLDSMFSIRFVKTKKAMPNLMMMLVLFPAIVYLAVVMLKEF